MAFLHLDSHKLATWQRGRRRYTIEQKYRYRLWHPTVLFSACMRRAIFQMSAGIERDVAASQAMQFFVSQAKSPGMDVPYGTDTYLLAMDLCATMKTVLAYLERITLTTLAEIPPIFIPSAYIQTPLIHWSFLAHCDESGLLHRWIFVDSIGNWTALKEAHKWETIADVVVYGSPMMLHFVAIGETVNGRRNSPWCRAYKSPAIMNVMKFKKKKGTLSEGWMPVWFADNMKNDPDTWLDHMMADGAHEGLVKHITVDLPAKQHIDGFYRDLKYEANQIAACDLTDPLQLPMCRTSCDIPYACPHQQVCYSLTTTFENSGLYELHKSTVPVHAV